MILELKPCLAAFNMDSFCFDMFWITANVSILLVKLSAPLDCTNPPLSCLMTLAKAIPLSLQGLKAVVHSAAGMSNSHPIYNNNPHLLPMEYPKALVTSMTQFGLAVQTEAEISSLHGL